MLETPWGTTRRPNRASSPRLPDKCPWRWYRSILVQGSSTAASPLRPAHFVRVGDCDAQHPPRRIAVVVDCIMERAAIVPWVQPPPAPVREDAPLHCGNGVGAHIRPGRPSSTCAGT